MSSIAIILAGGTGSRAGGSLPKQFQKAGGRRMLWWSVEAFHNFDPDCRIILTVHPWYLENWDEMFGEEEKELGIEVYKTKGGESRITSVINSLQYIDREFGDLKGENPTVYIHDAARPLVTPELIRNGTGITTCGTGAVPVVSLKDSIRKKVKGEETSVPVDRSEFMIVQTPQIFLYGDIKRAYDSVEGDGTLTDDASVAEKAGLSIKTFPGDYSNIKVTTPEDFAFVESLLQHRGLKCISN